MKHARHPHLRIVFAVVLVLLCFLPASTYIRAQQRIARQTAAKFDERTNEYVARLNYHLETYSNILYGAQALLAASTVDNTSWDRFIGGQALASRYPGMQAVAYAQVVPHEEATAFELNTQKPPGQENFHIHPRKDSGDYVLIVYHKETSEIPTSAQSVGLDIAGEATRRTALESSRKTGSIVATAPIKLATLQKTGFSLVTPVYNMNGTLSPEKPFGYVFAVFDIESLINNNMAAALSGHKTSMKIEDVTDGEPIPFFSKNFPTSQRTISREITANVGTRKWRITFAAPSSPILTITDRMAPNVMMSLSIVLILLFSTLVYIFRLRREHRKD